MSIVVLIFVCLIVGMVASFLSGLVGIGGGIIIIPAISTLFGLYGLSPDVVMHLAIGTSLASVPANALVAGLAHHKHQTIDWKLVKITAPGMLVGALIGPMITVGLSGEVLGWIFGIFLGILGVRFIIGQKERTERHVHSHLLLWIFSPIIGIVASMFGLGGGIFVVPLLTRLGVEMRQASAVSAFCLVPTSLVGMLGYIYRGWGMPGLPDFSTGFVYWPVMIALIVTGFICAPLGVRLAHRLPHQRLKRVFGVLLLVVAADMCYSAWSLYTKTHISAEHTEKVHVNVSQH